MKFEVNERLTTRYSKAEVLQALEQRFRRIASKTQREGDFIKATSIEASFGSINRSDTTIVSAKTVEGGFLLVADVTYRPSVFFWIFAICALFGTGILWILPVIFYLTQKKSVKSAIDQAFTAIKNELFQNVSAPPPVLAALPPAIPPRPPEAKLFVFLANEVKGPFTRDQLRALIETGAANNDTQVCPEGGDAWQPVSAYL